MRRGGPQGRAEASRGLQAARSASEERAQVAEAIRASLSQAAGDSSLAAPASSGGEAPEPEEEPEWLLVPLAALSLEEGVRAPAAASGAGGSDRPAAAAPRPSCHAPPSESAAVPQWVVDSGAFASDADLARAAKAGVNAGRKLSGEIERVPRSPPSASAAPSRHYVVLLSPHTPARGVGEGHWSDFARHVERSSGELHPAAVFHGFASHAEALAYWEAALPGVSVEQLPIWRR